MSTVAGEGDRTVPGEGRSKSSAGVSEPGTTPIAQSAAMRTGCDAYLCQRQGALHPRVESDAVRDFLTHLAVERRVSPSIQNQAFSAILFLCREVLAVEIGNLSSTVRARPAQSEGTRGRGVQVHRATNRGSVERL